MASSQLPFHPGDTLLDMRTWLCALAAIALVGTGVVAGQTDRSKLEIDDLKQALDDGATVLMIDVREDHEIVSGSIPGAIHIPMGQLEARMDDIPKDVRLVFF